MVATEHDDQQAGTGEVGQPVPLAVDAMLEGRDVPVPVTNPIGCNVKWKGQPAKWMPPEACDLV